MQNPIFSGFSLLNSAAPGIYVCKSSPYISYRLEKHENGTYTLVDKSRSVYEFDDTGRFISKTDKYGNNVSLTYTAEGFDITEQATGRKLSVTTNTEGLVQSVKSPEGVTNFTYETDEGGNPRLSKVEKSGGKKITYSFLGDFLQRVSIGGQDVFVNTAYDEYGRVLETQDGLGQKTTYSYDDTSEPWHTTVTKTNREGKTSSTRSNRAGQVVAEIDELGGATYYTYDGDGNMASTRDANNVSQIFVYENNNLVEISDANGKVAEMTYDENGNMLTQKLANGAQSSYSYNEKNWLVSATDERGITTTYDYGENGFNKPARITVAGLGTEQYEYENGQLISYTDFALNTFSYKYDAKGRLTEENLNGSYGVTKYAYDALDRLISVTARDGGVTKYTYDENGNTLTTTDPMGNVTEYEYDANNRLKRAKDAEGFYTAYDYSPERNLTKVTNAENGIFEFAYDDAGRLISEKNAAGEKTSYKLDPVGRILTQTMPNGGKYVYEYYYNGSLATATDPNGNLTQYGYTDMWQVNEIIDALGKTTNFTYDISGNLKEVTDAGGAIVTYTYDNYSRKTKETDGNGSSANYTYNELGLVTSHEDRMGFVTRYTYDRLGNVLTATDARNNTTYIEYDIMNRVSRVTDALKNENTRIYYDKNGNPTEYYDAYGLIQKIIYDGLNRPVAIEDALGNAVKTQYDGIGNVTTETDALNASTYYRYDKMGRLTEFTDSQNGVIRYDYSELGQTKSLTDANGNHTSWVYDLVGNLTYEKNAAGNEKLYEYDKLNRLEFFVNGRGERLEYKYDNTDMLTYAAGAFYTHDQNGNILTVANENGTTKREYDKNDRVTKFTDVNGNAIGYTYDEAGNLIKLTYPAGEVVSYTYDALNRITAVTDYNGRITKYEYDKNSRLVKTTRPDGSVEEITYDRAGRMTAKIDKAATGELISQYEYTYNANGDIIEEKDLPGNRTTPIKAESTEMTYGTANRLESVNGQVVSYDADGNMIKGVLGGGAASFGYDKFNRLIRVSAEGTENAENTTVYKYDGEGNRISVNNNGEITVFVTDPTGSLSNLLESRNSDGSKNIYVYGVGLISQEQVTAGATGKAAKATPENTTEYRLFHYDYRGSTTAITNASGNVTDRVVYSPYGKIDERTGETKTRFLYVGQFGVQVDENGLYYMRARYYDTLTSRMLTEDPYWDEENMIHGKGNDFIPIISKVKQSSNLYTYCMSSPMSYVDLTGMDAIYMTYTQGAHIAFWNFGHSAIAFQDADDNWWFMSFEGYNSSKLDIRVFFYQLTDIVWNDDMSKMIRANFLIPDEKGKSSTQHYYNGEKVDGEFIYDYRQISIYDSQVYINGDFSKSYDKALGYSMDYPFYWLTAVNCSWLALFVLQESTTGDTYDKLENYLWYLKINRNAVWPTPIVTKEIRTIIPNWSIEDINWLFEKEEE